MMRKYEKIKIDVVCMKGIEEVIRTSGYVGDDDKDNDINDRDWNVINV